MLAMDKKRHATILSTQIGIKWLLRWLLAKIRQVAGSTRSLIVLALTLWSPMLLNSPIRPVVLHLFNGLCMIFFQRRRVARC